MFPSKSGPCVYKIRKVFFHTYWASIQVCISNVWFVTCFFMMTISCWFFFLWIRRWHLRSIYSNWHGIDFYICIFDVVLFSILKQRFFKLSSAKMVLVQYLWINLYWSEYNTLHFIFYFLWWSLLHIIILKLYLCL